MPNGQLIDMRPRTTNPNVEVVINESVRVAGQIDDSAGRIDDEAADRAMATLVSHGLFAKQEERRFTFALYWRTPEQMQAYIEENRSDYAILPPQVVQRARELSPKGRPVHYRVREEIMIVDYRKRSATQPARGTG